MKSLHGLLGDQRGDSAIQYALVAGLVSVVVLVGSLALREPLLELYTDVGNQAGNALSENAEAGPTQDR